MLPSKQACKQTSKQDLCCQSRLSRPRLTHRRVFFYYKQQQHHHHHRRHPKERLLFYNATPNCTDPPMPWCKIVRVGIPKAAAAATTRTGSVWTLDESCNPRPLPCNSKPAFVPLRDALNVGTIIITTTMANGKSSSTTTRWNGTMQHMNCKPCPWCRHHRVRRSESCCKNVQIFTVVSFCIKCKCGVQKLQQTKLLPRDPKSDSLLDHVSGRRCCCCCCYCHHHRRLP